MKDQLEKVKKEFESVIDDVKDSVNLEEIRVQFLGRKGKIAEIMKGLPELAGDARKEIGQMANEIKKEIEGRFTGVEQMIERSERAARLDSEWIDVTAPGVKPEIGNTHLTSQAINEIVDIFEGIGFTRARHPEIDWDWYAFESLNLPKDHPARDEWETFFIADGDKVMQGEKGKVVLTPHTSNGQVRQMEKQQPPIRMININKCYRRQATLRHLPMFHQFEGLLIDKHITIADLKGTIDYFVKNYFGSDRETRLRPHHFRFTEPSFEVDISAEKGRENEKMFKAGWLEIGGAGMVHPNVIKAAGLDPEIYSGFAFGFGIERTAMMKSGTNIKDIRVMYRNDMRFLEQF